MKRLLFLSVCIAAFLAAAPAYAKAKLNPFGITIVRFERGTTPAQMQAAVANAGGVVITDLKNSTYFARLILQQQNELHTARKIVEVDARPSDCLAIAA